MQESANFQLGGLEKPTGAHDPRHALQKNEGLADQWYMDDGDSMCLPILVLSYLQNFEVANARVRSLSGSRAISVQVNIVAVSAHVFHSSLLVSCSLCLHIFAFNRSLSVGPVSPLRVVDASGTSVPESPMQFASSHFSSANGSDSVFEWY